MRRLVVLAIIGGAAVVVVAGVLLGLPATDVMRLAGIAVAAAFVAAVLGVMLLGWLRRSSMAAQTSVVALSCITVVAVGVVVAAREMFLSSHDLRALVVLLLAAGSVGIALALLLGDRVAQGGRTLGEATRRIAAGEEVMRLDKIGGEEFARLGRELEDMAAELSRARESERALERSRRELVAWVSHDLRTPLAGIRAMAEALDDGVVSDEATVARYHTALREEADRLGALVGDLFELSRFESGAVHLKKERIAIDDVVSDALGAVAATARAKGVRLDGRASQQGFEVALAEPEMMRVLCNLLDNAIRHTPRGGSVSVWSGVDGDHACVAVRDQCGGIPEADIGRVFDRAWRGEAARTPGANDSGGLGLAIAKGIVEAHGGRIAVSNEGDGCRFTLTIPLEATT